MSVKLRLSRGGAKKSPFYRIIAANSESRRDGKFLDHIGVYDPTTTPVTIRLKPERIHHWLSVGAQPTSTVHTIFKQYLGMAEERVKTLGLDGSSAVWVQGPANSPAAQGVKGGPAESNTRPKRTPRVVVAAAPVAAAPVAAAPVAAAPVAAAPVAAAPVAAAPVAAEPVAAEPVAAEPVAAEPTPAPDAEPTEA